MFYEYVPAISRCHDLCGDSVVMTDQCDNSFGVIHDGCTDTCQQETDYTCVLHPDTVSGQSVHRSICSYNLKVNITLKQIVKEPFKNTLTWTHFIVPFLYGLPGTTSRDFTQEELKKTFVLYDINQGPPTTLSLSTNKKKINSDGINQSNHKVSKVSVPVNLTIQSVSVNAAKSEVSITFSYDHDITQSDIELMVNFTYLRSTLNIPNFSTTPDSEKLIKVSSYRTDSMIGRFYTDDEYSLASTLNKLSLMIGLLSFVAFVIGVFSKELIGLQMVMLCQFTYISLFYFDGTLQLPLFALKSLVFSTGYNLQWSDLSYTQIDQNPPQSLTLDFDVMTLSHNFNLMSLLYVLPLILVIPFIPMKAKCIRKLSMIEMGHKWVDLLLGEIMLYIVLFNLQYFLFGMIVFYQDGRNTRNYLSQMIISFASLCTICSFLGLILKPELYGMFRSSFKYDQDLMKENFFLNKNKAHNVEKIQSKFQGQSKCRKLKNCVNYVSIFINQNYFWKKFHKLHTILTYNHYCLMNTFFVLIIFTLTLIKDSQIIIITISALMLVQVILMRPYGRVSQKLRSIYFFIIYTTVSLIRYFNNHINKGQQSLLSCYIILGMLIVAVMWTYVVLIKYFFELLSQMVSNRNVIVDKVFKNKLADCLDKQAVAQEEQALMRKLMKRYERVQLQYNINNVRNQLISGQDTIDAKHALAIESVSGSPTLKPQNAKLDTFLPLQLLKQAEQSNNFKDLKKNLQKQKRKKKKQEMKNKVSGEKLLKLLKLDNFTKYEEQFLKAKDQKKHRKDQEIQNNQQQQQQQSQQKQKDEKQIEQKSYQKVESIIDQLDDYKSVEPQDLQEAKEKLNEENVIIEENQFIRYERAKKIIAKQGLDLDKELIEQNYYKI